MPTPNELYDEAVDLKEGGNREEAIAKLDEAIALDPQFVIAHGMLAKLYVDMAESDKAITHAKKVVELEPDDTFSYTAGCRSSINACGKDPRSRARQGPRVQQANGPRVRAGERMEHG